MISREALLATSKQKSHVRKKNRRKMQQIVLPYLLLLPAFSVVLLFIVYPIFTTIIRSFQDGQTKRFTLDHYRYFLEDAIQRAHLLYTLKIVCITVVFALFFGYLLALYIRFSQSRLSRLVATLNLVPRFIPGLVAVYSVMLFIRDSGVINRVSQLFGYSFKPGWMFNETGIVLMNLWFNIPFVSLLILASLSSIQSASIEAAQDIGANRWMIFYKVIFPRTYKELLVALTFVFMGNVGSFTTPFLMGGNHPKMLGVALYDQFNSYMDYERTAALSVIMFLICSVSATFYIMSNLKKQK